MDYKMVPSPQEIEVALILYSVYGVFLERVRFNDVGWRFGRRSPQGTSLK